MSSPSFVALLAQGGRPAGSPWDRPDLLYGSLALAGALLAGGFVLFLVDRWRKRGDGPAEVGVGELTGYRGMLERGEITEEEYDRLRRKVAAKVKPAAPTSPVAGDGTPPPAAAPPLPGPLPDDYFDDPQPPAPPAQPN